MSQPLKVLIIEDSEDDTMLLIRELRHADFQPIWEQVQTATELRQILTTKTWDVILADYTLPQFSAPKALEIVQQSQLDIPFIVVAGSIGERSAVEMMKAGAHDYLMKDNLTRLPEAVRRELRDATIRAERRAAAITMKHQMAAMEAAIDAIAILQDNIYLYVNPAHLKLFGYQRKEDLIGKNWKDFYSATEVERLEKDIFSILENNRAWQGEAIATRQDGSTFCQGISLTYTEDGLLISVCRDISDLKRVQEQIIYDALHDPLTNLPNRTQLLERLRLAIKRVNRSKTYSYAVLFLDLNRFKIINDSLGHLIGDQLLIAVAKRLKSLIRNVDLVARLGGDEFVLLLEDTNGIEMVIQVAERILNDFQRSFTINHHQIVISVSIGIVIGNSTYNHESDLIRDADIAMYRAKTKEDNSYIFFDTVMYTQVLQRLTLETELRRALEQEEFILYYQPILNLLDHRLIGFEALVRWQNPDRGLLSPDIFISLAEETGLIVPLDKWVYHQACKQLAIWTQRHPEYTGLRVSVNLSAHEFLTENLIHNIDNILSKTGLHGASSMIEITESMLIKDISKTINVLHQLKERNIQICIDDFGTGYSSLSYLHQLPIDYLKIDRFFVSQIQGSECNHQIINTILTLSQQFGFTAVAEGIETPQQLQQLQTLGCQFGQGYLFAKPLSPRDVEQKFFN